MIFTKQPKFVIGVPITFMFKYNPKQFEIVGDSSWHDNSWDSNDIQYINGKRLYRRILIRKIK